MGAGAVLWVPSALPTIQSVFTFVGSRMWAMNNTSGSVLGSSKACPQRTDQATK